MQREATAPAWRREAEQAEDEQADIFRASSSSTEIIVRISTLCSGSVR
jgi:hypothetical protein